MSNIKKPQVMNIMEALQSTRVSTAVGGGGPSHCVSSSVPPAYSVFNVGLGWPPVSRIWLLMLLIIRGVPSFVVSTYLVTLGLA